VGTILDDDMRVFEEDGNEELLIISERLTDAMGTSGANPDDTELLRLLEQFNREAIERLGPSLLITFDPVDFRLTDLAGRTVGYTDAGGEVTEVPLAFYSGDGDVELVVIPGASQGVYGLQLSGVGTGEYRLAATLVTADGYSETIFEAQTLSGDQQLALDFTEQALPLRGQVTEELSAINGKKPGSNSNTGDTVTLTDELAIDLDDFSVSQFDAPSDRIMESSGWDEVWDAGAEFMKQLSQLFVQLTDEVYSQVDRFPTDGLAKVGGAADSVESLLLDSVFSGIEGQAFGAPGVLLFDLVEFLNSQKQQEKNDSSGKADDAESENGENEGQPADKTERENSDSAALQRIIRLRRSVKAEQSDRNSPRALPANTLEEKRTATESVRSGFELRVSDRRLKEAERRDHVEPPADTERRKESRQKKA
jgi:hypothetical protein